MDIAFDCTQCGKCCHGLRLPLSVGEARTWLGRGHEVQLLCEAILWPVEPHPADRQARYRRDRSFAATSGTMPARILVTLAAWFADACPNLQPDMRCGIYEERPRVCRIYPAEVNPFIALAKSAKACPPEAWHENLPPLIRGGLVADPTTASLIARSQQASLEDIAAKQRTCELLGLSDAALANEGFVVHSPDTAALADALARASSTQGPQPAVAPWRFVSANTDTVTVLREIGAHAVAPADTAAQYIGLSG